AFGACMEALRFEGAGYLFGDSVEARENPAVLKGCVMEAGNAFAAGFRGQECPCNTGLDTIQVHEHEAGGVPDFVGEGAVALRAAFIERNIGAGSSHGCQSKARSVGSEAFDDMQRINYVALGFRHLLPFGIAYQRVNVNLSKRDAVIFLVAPAAGRLQL